VFTEGGRRRYRQGATEAKLAAKLAAVTERLEADAPDMERPGADLIAWYLSADRLPAGRRWSRKHAHTQRRLCERFAAPVIGMVACQDIKIWHMQQFVNATPSPAVGAALADASCDHGLCGPPRVWGPLPAGSLVRVRQELCPVRGYGSGWGQRGG
jgi:hypothetical protein